MTLQLPSVLDASSDERVDIWDHGIGRENLLNLVGDWKENRVYSIGEKTS